MSESKVHNWMRNIPVYPDSVWMRPKDSCKLPSSALLCEDEGRVSYISQEAKEEYLRDYQFGSLIRKRTI